MIFRKNKIRIQHHPHPHIKKKMSVWTKFLWGFIVLFIGLIIWVALSGLLALKNINVKNTSDEPNFFRYGENIPPELLKNEGDGRINVLLIGIGGSNHPGGQLADTIQILSIDPINKTFSTLSIPRDLYVTLPNGTKSKINAAYANGKELCQKLNDCSNASDQGADVLKKVITDNLGIPIHYFARLDFTGFEQLVDAIGGIEVNVEKALVDPLYPDERMQGYSPLYIPAGFQKFDGKKALKYARSRETTSDFDRSRRQQQILLAIKEKALKLNILTNPKKLTDIAGILGAHLRTDLKPNEIIRLVNLISSIKSNNTTNTVLNTGVDSPLKSYNDSRAGYIIVPKKGMNDFTEVQDYIKSILKEPFIIKENAKIKIVSANNNLKYTKEIGTKLSKLGYNVVKVEETKSTSYITKIAKISDKPYTFSLLKKRFTAAEEKVKDSSSQDFDIILTIGTNYQKK